PTEWDTDLSKSYNAAVVIQCFVRIRRSSMLQVTCNRLQEYRQMSMLAIPPLTYSDLEDPPGCHLPSSELLDSDEFTQLVLEGFPHDSSPGVVVEQLYEYAEEGGEEAYPIDEAAINTSRMAAKNEVMYFFEYAMGLIREHSADSRRMWSWSERWRAAASTSKREWRLMLSERYAVNRAVMPPTGQLGNEKHLSRSSIAFLHITSLQPSSPKPDTSPSRASSSDRQLQDGAISDLEALYLIGEYLWHTEIQDLFLGRQSFARLCESLGSDDISDVVARCLALLVESVDGMDDPVVERGQWLRVHTLMALQYISFGCSLAEDSPCDTLVPLMRSASEMFYHEGVLRCMVLLLDKLLVVVPLDSAYMLTRKRDAGYLPEDPRPCELLLARELRCCFNIIYVCLLFNLHRPDFTEECLGIMAGLVS
ncbi:hypothetical protein FOZ63_030641, partial [Perkinsus olseni]